MCVYIYTIHKNECVCVCLFSFWCINVYACVHKPVRTSTYNALNKNYRTGGAELPAHFRRAEIRASHLASPRLSRNPRSSQAEPKQLWPEDRLKYPVLFPGRARGEGRLPALNFLCAT